ncbi:MAG: NapC/NirT family cytochrome c [Anaeromyxobacteraceae bacterium]
MATDGRAPRNLLGLLGASMAIVSGVLIVGLALAGLFGFAGSPYIGIIAYLVLPMFFVGGLLLIPVGSWLSRRAARRAAELGVAAPELPVIDLNEGSTRKKVVAFVAITAVNVVIVAFAGYQGFHVMESPGFCGKTCHKVMDPEYTAYQRSPHARVACVECHIGPGASWFVKSKLSGAWQLVSVTFNLYSKPIPTPVHALRPARETCEACHWPAKFAGDRLLVKTVFAEDEQNSEQKTVLLMHVGGADAAVGRPSGIHAHVAPGVQVRYLSDPERKNITTVESIFPDGQRRVFKTKDSPAADPGEAAWRTMDCVDCHNRASHRFRQPGVEIDLAIQSGRIDRSLPFVRREAVKALKADYVSREDAKVKIREALVGFYRTLDPATFDGRAKAVDATAEAVGDIYGWNIWPNMKIGWGTYASKIGHEETPGCFRCHDDEHKAEDGKVIKQDCDLCHAVLAQEEKDPSVLKALKP